MARPLTIIYWGAMPLTILNQREIDEDALREKQALLAGRISAASDRRLSKHDRDWHG
jgi:hypothetical protein